MLVLNATNEPINVWTVRRATVLLLKEKAEVIEIGPHVLHWARGSMTKPVGIRLITYVRIPRDSEALYLLQQVRDEAHRFAITYHRQLRDKKMTKSVLDDVAGLGPVRRRRLLKEFGSVKKLRAMSEDDLRTIPWLPDAVAEGLHAALHA